MKRLGERKDTTDTSHRGYWSSQTEFVLSALGSAVGLGNVWRFPYLCYKNGGGAFLVPYLITLFVAALPLYFMEFALGQYSSQGVYTVWRSVPLLKGIGIGQTMLKFFNCISYNVVIMYCFYYFFASFTRSLPWVGCTNDWNTQYCSSLYDECLQSGGIITYNNTCTGLGNMTTTELGEYNITAYNATFDLSGYRDPFGDMRVTPSEEYWKNQVLQESGSMNDTGGLVWQLALCLILTWTICFLCLYKSIKSMGKIVYFTAIFPYVVLFILLIRGCSLPGALDGILFFIVPRWESLKDSNVWLDAAIQILYSLGVCGGSPLTMASFNKFNNNFYRDAIVITICNSLTSILAGFVIFSTIGFMAHDSGKPVERVVSQGFGLAFMVYPEALVRLTAGPVWSVMFFLMLITLGIDSQYYSVVYEFTGFLATNAFLVKKIGVSVKINICSICVNQIAGIEVVVTTITDVFPRHLRRWKQKLTLLHCCISLLAGFTCVTRAGSYWMSLIDQYCVNFHRLVFCLMEAAAISWIYGIRRFKNDIRVMIGNKFVDHFTFWYWTVHLCVIVPGVMLVLLLAKFINYRDPNYNGAYPDWAVGIGWLLMLSSLVVIPLDWTVQMVRSSGTLLQRVQLLLRPEPSWGPSVIEDRHKAYDIHIQYGTTMGGVVDGGENHAKPMAVLDLKNVYEQVDDKDNDTKFGDL